MGDRANKIVFFVVVGLLSMFLALMSEGLVLQYNPIFSETPGMYVGQLLFPTGGWETFGREWLTWIAVDSLICFVIVWQVVRAAERFRERHSRH